jgi:predicted nucleic acid-binding protein
MVKVYVREPGRSDVLSAMARAARWSTSVVSYAELRAALAAAHRDHRLDDLAFALAKGQFTRDWQQYLAISTFEQLLERAGDLSELHSLRGFDAIQLASAMTLRDSIHEDIEFAVADGRLRSGATSEGFVVN